MLHYQNYPGKLKDHYRSLNPPLKIFTKLVWGGANRQYFLKTSPDDSKGFPGSSADKESVCKAGDLALIPGSGRSPGEGKGYQVQYSWASGSHGEESANNSGDLGSIPGL